MTRRTALFSVFCTLLLASSALAVAIPNHSFEDGANDSWVTSVSNWTLLPPVTFPPTAYRAGLFFDFDGYKATQANAFAVLTHRNSGGQSLISSSMTLGAEDDILRFDYLYVSKNQPGDATHIDPFTVTLYEGTTALQTWTVSDTDDTDLGLGTISSTPFGGTGSWANTYDTGWQTFTVSILDYVGRTVYLDFRINDSAQQGGGTGFFLDRVAITPEPGTFLLFGIGAIGLTLYSRRKMRRKK